MKQETRKQARREKYHKPVLREIELSTQEVLAPGCKLAGGGTAIDGTPCAANNCAADGS